MESTRVTEKSFFVPLGFGGNLVTIAFGRTRIREYEPSHYEQYKSAWDCNARRTHEEEFYAVTSSFLPKKK